MTADGLPPENPLAGSGASDDAGPDWLPLGRAQGQTRDFPAMALALLPCLLETVNVLDVDGSIIASTADLTGALGYAQGWQGRVPFDLIHPDDRDRVASVFAQCVNEPGSSFSGQFRLYDATGKLVHVEAVIHNLLDQPAVAGLVVTSRNITSLVEAQESLRQAVEALDHQASYDYLTDLPNRAALIRHLETLLVPRRSDPSLIAMYVDLDEFKAINDTHGHHVGDEVLKVVAQRLTGAIRKSDFVARIGGDEFLVINHGRGTTPNWTITADRIRSAINDDIRLDELTLRVTASVGVVAAHGPASATEILRQADIAMYRAKDLGRDQYHFEEIEPGP